MRRCRRKGGQVRLTGDQARDWLRALNDIRLMFGVRLEVTEDFEDQLAALDPKDPRLAAFEVYGWLGAVQESLVARARQVVSPIMLTISRALYEKIIEHARKDHPDEACGVIAGPDGSDTPTRFIPMQNAERSPTFYRFDSREQLKVWREMDDNGRGSRRDLPLAHRHRRRTRRAPTSPTRASRRPTTS